MVEMVAGQYFKSNMRIVMLIGFIFLLYLGITLPIIIFFSFSLLIEIIGVIHSFIIRHGIRKQMNQLIADAGGDMDKVVEELLKLKEEK